MKNCTTGTGRETSQCGKIKSILLAIVAKWNLKSMRGLAPRTSEAS